MAQGVHAAAPQARVLLAPLVDGGEGFTEALVEAAGGICCPVSVTGPVGDPVSAHFGLLENSEQRTAVLEMAAAAGLRLVPRTNRDPRCTTSYGVGELIRAALDAGTERILVGCGDSGINDGGAGMAQALGVQLLDAEGKQIGRGGAELANLRHIDLSARDPRLEQVQIDVAVNCEALGLIPRRLRRNSKAFFINQYPAPWGGVVNCFFLYFFFRSIVLAVKRADHQKSSKLLHLFFRFLATPFIIFSKRLFCSTHRRVCIRSKNLLLSA
jgi:hypothetical protein